MKVMVLGCGMVGREIVKDLVDEGGYSVTVVDRDEAALARVTEGGGAHAVVRDLTKPGATGRLARGQDLVVGALPSRLGMQVVREAVEEGVPAADISFMPEDPFTTLDELARAQGVPVMVDCGAAPGTSNLLVGRAVSKLDQVTEVRILVGGLPVVRHLPYEYAMLFSPIDVLAEYIGDAIIIQDGRQVVRPALDELELVEFPGLGTLEAFITNGLRTLLRTVKARNMKEKTLRYPGHCEKVRLLAETGLLEEAPITVDGVSVRPRDVTAHLLSQMWQLPEGEEDLTVMSVSVQGVKDGEDREHVFQLVDVYDPDKGVTSMARTTGYACTSMISLVASGALSERDMTGVIPMELVGREDELYQKVISHLRQRGIVIGETVD